MAEPKVVEEEALKQMRERGGSWMAWQNIAMDSRDLGRIQYIKFGPGCTYETPPERCPDTAACGPGWKYQYLGIVNLESGVIELRKP